MPVAGGSLRAVRGLIVGACCLALSLLGHGLAGGGVPPLRAVVPLGCGLALVCTWLSSRRWTFATLFAVLTAAQLALHPVFTAMAPPARPAGGAAAAGWAAMVMAAAHLLAALATAGVLLHGEDWVHRWTAMLCGRRPSRLPALPAAVERVAGRLPSPPSLARPKVLTGGSAARRGPPGCGRLLTPA